MKIIYTRKGEEIFVDDEDYEWLNQYNWYSSQGYATRATSRKDSVKRKYILMHREITNAPKGMVIDHKDHKTMNNQKENLRICTHKENAMNKKIAKSNNSGYPGVYWSESQGRWIVRIGLDRGTIRIGTYMDWEDAVRARQDAEIKYFGEFKNEYMEIDQEKYDQSSNRKTTSYKKSISGVKGISWNSSKSKFETFIPIESVPTFIGAFRELSKALEIKIIAEKERDKLIELEGVCDIDNLRINIFGTRLDHKNKSGTTGVYFNNNNQKWYSFIQINRKKIHLGVYETKEEAVISRKNAIIERDNVLNTGKIIDINKLSSVRTPGSPRSNNTSGVTGVIWRKPLQKWFASIQVDKKVISLGYYYALEDAKKAREEGEKKYLLAKNDEDLVC